MNELARRRSTPGTRLLAVVVGIVAQSSAACTTPAADSADSGLEAGANDGMTSVDADARTDLRALFKGVLADQMGVANASLSNQVFPDSAGATPIKGLIRA